MQVDSYTLEHGDGAWPFNHTHIYPADGTFVITAAGTVFRFAGGAALNVSNCSVLGGCPVRVLIDQTAINNAGQAGVWAHIAPYPLDGTSVETLPSGSYYEFRGGHCGVTTPTPGAVAVNDGSVSCSSTSQ